MSFGANTTTAVNSAINLTLCNMTEVGLHRNIVITNVNSALLAITLVAIVKLVHNFSRCPITAHRNLLILFGNIIFVTLITCVPLFVMNIRYTILYLGYKNGCDLLTTFWQNVLFLGTQYLYCFAYPLFHFAIMLERARATFMAEKYENTGNRLGILMAIGIWMASILYTAIIIFTAYIDPEISSHPQAVVSLASEYNNKLIVYLYIAIIPFVMFTAFCDWRITLINWRLRASSANYFRDYTLSRNYQLNENTLVMRLILPLNVFYALLYTIYTALTIVIRIYSSTMAISKLDYIFYYYCANSLNYAYWIITFIVYIRFVNFVGQKQRRKVYAQQPQEPTKIYFRQLTVQWNM